VLAALPLGELVWLRERLVEVERDPGVPLRDVAASHHAVVDGIQAALAKKETKINTPPKPGRLGGVPQSGA